LAGMLRVEPSYQAALSALDDGSSPYPVEYVPGNPFHDPVCKAMQDAILKAVESDDAAGASFEAAVTANTDAESEAVLPTLARIVGGTLAGDKIELDGDMAQAARVKLNVGASARPWMGKSRAMSYLVDQFEGPIKNALKAKKAAKAKEGLALDVDALIGALDQHSDTQGVRLGTDIYVKPRDPYSGSATLQPGTYIFMGTAYKSGLSNLISAKGAGLEGRCFDKAKKVWVLPLIPVQMSDGKTMATVQDLCKMAGIDYQQFSKA
ncbi:MAG: hypothetical protein KAY21_10985, partial [Limnohabitans sp.]|nr:hypothetical protein [Limnohabitans sp.]